MQQKPILSGSILSADFSRLGEDVSKALEAGLDWVHFDVMDRHYVPNLTFGSMVCKALREYGIQAPIDAHLMVSPAEPHVDDFINAKVDYITIHPDTTNHLYKAIDTIQFSGKKCGVALNPAMTLDGLEFILEKIDLILLMTVNPGFGGQKFIKSVLTKISRARDLIDKSGRQIRLQVDGGINADNISEIYKSGADTFVLGSHIFNSNDYVKTISVLKEKLA